MSDPDPNSDQAGADHGDQAGRPGGDLEPADRRRLATRRLYRRNLADYAREFSEAAAAAGLDWSVSVPTLKRWVSRGRQVPEASGGPDFPPFDNPPDLAAWFGRRFSKKVPEVFARFEGIPTSGAPNPESGAAAGSMPPAGDQAGADPDRGSATPAAVMAAERLAAARQNAANVEVGFAAALRRCEEAEALAYARWQEELNRTGEEYAPNAEKERREAHDKALSKLNQMQDKAAKHLAASAEFARWSDVVEIVSHLLANVRAGLQSLVIRIGSKLKIPEPLFGKLQQAFDRELDRIFKRLEQADFEAIAEQLAIDD